MPLILGAFVFATTLASPPFTHPHVSSTQSRVACSDSLASRLRRELSPWLATRAGTGAFSGVVVVACDGRIIYSETHGLAHRAQERPITLQTQFNVGSMNKSWTAVAIGQLVESGKVSLDAPVGRYLPDFPNAVVREQVLVRHLLSHTSGLGSYFVRGFLRDRVAVSSAAEYLPFYAPDSVAFTPGERFRYSNAGFALLGAIIERVSGMNYFEYMERNVLQRAGMSGASFADVRSPTADMAMTYARAPGAQSEAESYSQLEVRSGPAGGAFATAADVIAFSRALWGGRLIAQTTVREFTTGKSEEGRYGFGFGTSQALGPRTVGHNGGAPGVGAEWSSFPELGIDLVVLTNIDMPVATQVAARAAAIISGRSVP